MQDHTKGLIALLAANVIWGLSPLYYKVLASVPAVELLAHRTLWSLVFFGAVVAFQGRLLELRRSAKGWRAILKLALASAFIAFNWGVFIWSIQAERAMESSIGYYIFPLISVVLGIVVFREGLAVAKILAFAIAMSAVLVLTLGLGAAPWIALSLALSFAGYGIIKKTTAVGPVLSVTAEVIVLTPVALAWLVWVHLGGAGAFGGSLSETLLLMLSGPLTAFPLILFSYASRRLSFATLGLVLYLNPTLQLFVATLIFGEPFTLWHAIAVPMIWVALAIYSADAVWRERSARKASTSASTS